MKTLASLILVGLTAVLRADVTLSPTASYSYTFTSSNLFFWGPAMSPPPMRNWTFTSTRTR